MSSAIVSRSDTEHDKPVLKSRLPLSTVTLQQAQSQLPELISRLSPGEEVLIADQGQPVAKLVRSERTSWPCKAGSARGTILWIAPDFDAPPEEFKEYME